MNTYYIIRKRNAPPAITESWKAARYWEEQGCDVIRVELPALPLEA